jgi:hypothetical protein
MLFEKRESNGSLSSSAAIGLQFWNRRQARRHQYTPSVSILGGGAGALSERSRNNEEGFFLATMNRNCPDHLPKSHRRLQWEKRMHCATVAPFVDKITASPPPQEKEYLQRMFAAGLASRREVSHAALQRSIGGHQRAI